MLWMVVMGTEKGAAIKGVLQKNKKRPVASQRLGVKDLKDTEVT